MDEAIGQTCNCHILQISTLAVFRVNEILDEYWAVRLADLSRVIFSLVEVIVSLTAPAKARGRLVLAITVCSRSRGDTQW